MPVGEKRQFKDRDGDWREVDDAVFTRGQTRANKMGNVQRTATIARIRRAFDCRVAALEKRLAGSVSSLRTQLNMVRRAANFYRSSEVRLPDINTGAAPGSAIVGCMIPHKCSRIDSIRVGYETVPSSAGGAIVLDVYKTEQRRSSLTINGAVDSNGDVTVTAVQVGEQGIQYAHVVGATGAGNENRALAVAVVGKDITVTFGTDGAGASVVPTAAQVVALLAGDTDARTLIGAAAGGTGAGAVGTAALAPLTGGLAAVLILEAAGFDLESLSNGVAEQIALVPETVRCVREDQYIYAKVTWDNADAVDGVGGILTLSFSLQAK